MTKAKQDWTELSTPCFLIHDDAFRSALQECHEALENYFPANVLGYSVKTNHAPYLLESVRQCGHYAEVVSTDEYRLARKLGFTPERIIYNGPMKDKETFQEAVQRGAVVNIETKRELQWLAELPWTLRMRVGLRLHIPERVAQVDDEKAEGSRFGFSLASGELGKALQTLQKLGFQHVGIHAHHTTRTRSLAYYKAVCSYVGQVAQQLSWQPAYVDMGGGFYGHMPGKPTYAEYTQVMHEALSAYLPMQRIPFIIEPGNALVASVVDYICGVIDVKDTPQGRICTTDGSRIDVDPLWHKNSYQTELSTVGKKVYVGKQLLTGCTCKEDDKLLCLADAPELTTGDKILCRWQGAYTMAMSPLFIRQLCRVYVEEKGAYRLVQDAWGAEDWLRGYRGGQPDVRILFSNAGRRAKLIQDFRDSLGSRAMLIATDNWSVAPALFQADKAILVPKWTAPNYMKTVMALCKQEHIQAILTCVDPEIDMLAAHKDEFKQKGILPLVPSLKTAKLCFDKYAMYQYLTKVGIPTPRTWASLDEFLQSTGGGRLYSPSLLSREPAVAA